MTEQVDQIVHARWVLPMEQSPAAESVDTNRFVYEHYSVVIRDAQIVDVLATADASQKYTAKYEINRPDHLVMPGLINAHTHAAMTLLRGYADDLHLMEWLQDYIWPAESQWVDREFVRVGSQLAMVESLLSGVTCFNDMYFFPDEVANIAQEMGFRLNLSSPILEFPSAWAEDAQEYIDKALALVTQYRDHPLISAGLGPHAPYTVSDESLTKIAEQANVYDTWIHMHVHETRSEVETSVAENGCRPIQRLERLGLLSDRFQAVHMTHLTDEDLASVQKANVSVVHCPESNLKLASGFCPVSRLLQQNTRVCLGTDGAASNNDLDLISEMRSAALLAKAVADDASAYNAYQVLYAATHGAAQCFNMQDRIGSLSVGKDADLVAIDLNDWATQPVYHPVSQVVYAASARQVNDVWVRGQHLVQNRTLPRLDSTGLRKKVAEFQRRISEKNKP